MQPWQMVFAAIGTQWQIDIFEETPADLRERLLSIVLSRIDLFDKTYSRFRADSLVTAMALSSGTYQLPEDATELLRLYLRLYDLTGGLFTPLIGQVMVDAGYDASYSLVTKTVHAPPTWDDVMEYHAPMLEMKKPALLDVGAAGKGYLIDIVARLLEEHGVRSFCIDAGGDIVHHRADGTRLRVGLEHPSDTTQVIGVVEIGNESICGSAGNRRTWGDFHHIIDPATLASPRHLLATWVIAKTTIFADAIATCLYFATPSALAAAGDFEYLLLYPDFSIKKSDGFTAELFLA